MLYYIQVWKFGKNFQKDLSSLTYLKGGMMKKLLKVVVLGVVIVLTGCAAPQGELYIDFDLYKQGMPITHRLVSL